MKLLVFSLNNQEYSFDISSVKEIKNWIKSTPVPSSPDYFEGIINIRGEVIPIINLSRKIGFSKVSEEKKAIIIIENKKKLLSFSVNSVSDIIESEEKNNRSFPSMENKNRFIENIVSIDSRTIFNLDISYLINECICE